MKLKQTKVLIFLVVLFLASIIRPSESHPPEVYCMTDRIYKVPGCYDALKIAVLDRDIRWLSVECCRAVFATLPPTCLLKVKGDVILPMTSFREICDFAVPAAAQPSS
ncbi:PREDICTED: uncharacterized protein LOC104763373 [Camelina sativa]|uniref:Uncharacterized protein LOC104763373 n=1 Tax=Camelina sativa TaxID=90675 RepID=A0ABM0XF65_CAMSA|nr:PREDICTED: uncharacterized protein LOC104763373 [Camelina sativa]